MKSIIITLLIGILGTIIFEIINWFFLSAKDFIIKKNLKFSLNGYWKAYITYEYKGIMYSAWELMILKYRNGFAKAKIYQATRDNRYYECVCCGYMQNDKLVLAYKETKQQISNDVGVIILRTYNSVNHEVVLKGSYCEFEENAVNCIINSYTLEYEEFSIKQKIMIKFNRNKYVYELLSNYFK